MASVNIGDRVGAILSADHESVRFLGYGTYEGDKTDGPLEGIPNPCILLDNGKRVYGCQCWWGPEEKIKTSIGERRIEVVDLSQEVSI